MNRACKFPFFFSRKKTFSPSTVDASLNLTKEEKKENRLDKMRFKIRKKVRGKKEKTRKNKMALHVPVLEGTDPQETVF